MSDPNETCQECHAALTEREDHYAICSPCDDKKWSHLKGQEHATARAFYQLTYGAGLRFALGPIRPL